MDRIHSQSQHRLLRCDQRWHVGMGSYHGYTRPSGSTNTLASCPCQFCVRMDSLWCYRFLAEICQIKFSSFWIWNRMFVKTLMSPKTLIKENGKMTWKYQRLFVKHCSMPLAATKSKKLFLASRSQGHWPWCHLKGHHKWSMHAKYEVSISYGSKVITNVKVYNRQTDWQDKKNMPPIIRSGGIKMHIFVTSTLIPKILHKGQN